MQAEAHVELTSLVSSFSFAECCKRLHEPKSLFSLFIVYCHSNLLSRRWLYNNCVFAPTIVCTPVVLDLDLLVKFTVRKFWCMLLCSWWCQAVWSSFCICNTNSSSCSGRPQHHASLLLLWLVGVSIYLFIVFLISCVNNKHVWYFTIYTCYECCSSLLNLLAPPFIHRACCYLLCYTRSRCFGC